MSLFKKKLSEVLNGNEKVYFYDFEIHFPPIGHPLHHFKKYPYHPWLRTKKEIKSWLKKNISSKDYKVKVHDDLTVSVSSPENVYIRLDSRIEKIMVQFRNFELFDLSWSSSLESLIGTPYVTKHMYLCYLENINSLEGLSESVKRNILLNGTNISTFKNMPNFDSSNVSLIMEGGKLTSWEGFTRCFKISFNEEVSDDLILNAPDSVDYIVLNENRLKDNSILKFYEIENIDKSVIKNLPLYEVRSAIDMEWLREYQSKRLKPYKL